MKKHTSGIILAFVIGQVVQIVLALFAQVAFINRPILFSIFAGFLILAAATAGVLIASADENKDAKHSRRMTYQEYADALTEEINE